MSDRDPDDRSERERSGTTEARSGSEETTAERDERTTDREERTEYDEGGGRVAGGESPGGSGDESDDDGGGLSGGLAILVSAIIALVVTALAYWWVGGFAGEVFFENLFRVAPTVEGGGVGTDWVVGNTVPWLDALIAIVHAADVLMGVFILAMVFLHWAAFRRLAGRMRQPVRAEDRGTVATDGGEASRSRSDGGENGQSQGGED